MPVEIVKEVTVDVRLVLFTKVERVLGGKRHFDYGAMLYQGSDDKSIELCTVRSYVNFDSNVDLYMGVDYVATLHIMTDLKGNSDFSFVNIVTRQDYIAKNGRL